MPSTGQRRISLLASIRPGSTAATSGMSSHEMWFATTSAPARASPADGCGRPITRTRTPNARTTPYAHHRINRSRGAWPSNSTAGKHTTPTR
ncbi:hypothetical protein [Streptomyces sp. LN500]|uniref:hypothetical protein n=1 Tax=Streptomyces sp. LN500 TaxID=3112978 RepID=UPI0037231182